MIFEWDETKNLDNIKKHNVSFATAQEAFYDNKRIIIKDKKHSKKEERFYCIGNDGNGILTVRFTMRNENIRIFGAGYWREGKDNMNKRKINYTEAQKNISRAITEGKIAADFLPPPDELVRKEPKVKITITLNTGSVDFFKKHARKNNVKYQTMINEVLDKYVQRYR